MESRLYASTMFALYQLSVLIGIVLLPFAIVARRVGIALPIHKLVTRLGDAYEKATSEQDDVTA